MTRCASIHRMADLRGPTRRLRRQAVRSRHCGHSHSLLVREVGLYGQTRGSQGTVRCAAASRGRLLRRSRSQQGLRLQDVRADSFWVHRLGHLLLRWSRGLGLSLLALRAFARRRTACLRRFALFARLRLGPTALLPVPTPVMMGFVRLSACWAQPGSRSWATHFLQGPSWHRGRVMA